VDGISKDEEKRALAAIKRLFYQFCPIPRKNSPLIDAIAPTLFTLFLTARR